MGGLPCIRGLRFPVATVVAMVADGMTTEDILAEHPGLTRAAADGMVLARAAAEGRVLISADTDFGGLLPGPGRLSRQYSSFGA